MPPYADHYVSSMKDDLDSHSDTEWETFTGTETVADPTAVAEQMDVDPQDENEDEDHDENHDDSPANDHIWGYLKPVEMKGPMTQIDFWRLTGSVAIGRNSDNRVVLPGKRISAQHCIFTWNGSKEEPEFVLNDLSSNGTYVNGEVIGQGNSRLLKQNDEIAFGTSANLSHLKGGTEDYRYIFKPILSGIHRHYDFGRKLGEGQFGIVRYATHKVTRKEYAVKSIDSKNLQPLNPSQKSKFDTVANEISVMETLDHPNVCKITEHFFRSTDEFIHLVCEFVEGGDLFDYIVKSHLTEAEVQDIMYQLCDTLAYLHAHSITHRDLKPENILITKDKPPRIKICDFGFSKVSNNNLQRHTTLVGTPAYIAPEVVQGRNVRSRNSETMTWTPAGYTNRIDCFALGCIAFVCLTKTEAFDLEQPVQKGAISMEQIRHRIRNSFQECHNVSRNAQEFVLALLTEDPSKRPSVEEALELPWLVDYHPVYKQYDWRGPMLQRSKAKGKVTTTAKGSQRKEKAVKPKTAQRRKIEAVIEESSTLVEEDTFPRREKTREYKPAHGYGTRSKKSM